MLSFYRLRTIKVDVPFWHSGCSNPHSFCCYRYHYYHQSEGSRNGKGSLNAEEVKTDSLRISITFPLNLKTVKHCLFIVTLFANLWPLLYRICIDCGFQRGLEFNFFEISDFLSAPHPHPRVCLISSVTIIFSFGIVPDASPLTKPSTASDSPRSRQSAVASASAASSSDPNVRSYSPVSNLTVSDPLLIIIVVFFKRSLMAS